MPPEPPRSFAALYGVGGGAQQVLGNRRQRRALGRAQMRATKSCGVRGSHFPALFGCFNLSATWYDLGHVCVHDITVLPGYIWQRTLEVILGPVSKKAPEESEKAPVKLFILPLSSVSASEPVNVPSGFILGASTIHFIYNKCYFDGMYKTAE